MLDKSNPDAIGSVAEMRGRAKRVLPRMVFDYVDGGVGDEGVVAANRAALRSVRFLSRVLTDVSARRLGCTLFGEELAMPLLIAPTGLSGLLWPHGELEAARAAQDAGTAIAVSAAATESLEAVAQATSGPKWFQQFIYRDRRFTRELMARAQAAGYETLCITVDVQVSPQRDRDVRNGFAVPLRMSPRVLGDLARHPRWCLRMWRHRHLTLENFRGASTAAADVASVAQHMNRLIDPGVTWADLEWVREHWPGNLVVKGVLDPEDARSARAAGADAIVVSNHGGRQLDRAVPTLVALPEVVSAVGSDMPVLLDGGVERGADVIAAMGMGASAVMIGRAHLWGLAVAGRAGVRRVLTLLAREMDEMLATMGVSGPDGVRERILPPT